MFKDCSSTALKDSQGLVHSMLCLPGQWELLTTPHLNSTYTDWTLGIVKLLRHSIELLNGKTILHANAKTIGKSVGTKSRSNKVVWCNENPGLVLVSHINLQWMKAAHFHLCEKKRIETVAEYKKIPWTKHRNQQQKLQKTHGRMQPVVLDGASHFIDKAKILSCLEGPRIEIT